MKAEEIRGKMTTKLVQRMIDLSYHTKKDLAEMLDISRPTLDSRLSGRSKWKKLEMNFIRILWAKGK